MVCKLLQDLAWKQGKTIITTIHQPSSESFHFFDRLLLMCDGKVVYQGLGQKVVPYFGEMGYTFPKFSNPADGFMKIISVNYPKQDEDIKKIADLVDHYQLKMATKVTEQYQAITCYAPDLGKSSTLHRTSMAIQWSTLWWRNVLFSKRQPLVIIGRIAMCIFLAGSMLTVYWHKLGWHRHDPLHPFPDQEEIQNTTGAMFLLMMEIMLANSLCNFLVFQVERECFLREY
jgi:hypothetical protein